MKKSIMLALLVLAICVTVTFGQHIPIIIPHFNDEIFYLYDNSDPTRKLMFELEGINTDTIRTWIVPNYDVVANGFIDWTTDQGATNIHSNNLAVGLTDIAGLTPTDSNFIVGDGNNWVSESGATARASMGLGTIATYAGNQNLQTTDSVGFDVIAVYDKIGFSPFDYIHSANAGHIDVEATAIDLNANTIVGGTLAAGATSITGDIAVTGLVNQGTPSTARAFRSGNQTISSGNWVKVQLNAESWDTKGEFDAATNYRFQATQSGLYQVNVAARLLSIPAGTVYIVAIWKSGALYTQVEAIPGGTAAFSLALSDIVVLNGSTDYVELYVYQNSGGNLTLHGHVGVSFMSVQKLS